MTSSAKKNIDLLAPAIVTGAVGYWVYSKKGVKDWKVFLLIEVVAFVVAYLITSRITKVAVDSSIASMDTQLQQDMFTSLGVTAAEYNDCKAIAEKIFHAFHDHWYEDEEMAIDALNSAGTVPKVKAVAKIYSQNYGYDLKSEFDRYTSTFNRDETPFADYVTQALNLS